MLTTMLAGSKVRIGNGEAEVDQSEASRVDRVVLRQTDVMKCSYW